MASKKAEDGTDQGLNKLNEALQEFQENAERLPGGLEELVAKGYLRALPVPPAGKRYQLNKEAGRVELVNR
jgi:hypothetical protein